VSVLACFSPTGDARLAQHPLARPGPSKPDQSPEALKIGFVPQNRTLRDRYRLAATCGARLQRAESPTIFMAHETRRSSPAARRASQKLKSSWGRTTARSRVDTGSKKLVCSNRHRPQKATTCATGIGAFYDLRWFGTALRRASKLDRGATPADVAPKGFRRVRQKRPVTCAGRRI